MKSALAEKVTFGKLASAENVALPKSAPSEIVDWVKKTLLRKIASVKFAEEQNATLPK